MKQNILSNQVPLLLAYITRYIFGTDKLRPNAFEVRGINGSNTGVVHCQDLGVLSSWIKLISDNITGMMITYCFYQNGRCSNFDEREQSNLLCWQKSLSNLTTTCDATCFQV